MPMDEASNTLQRHSVLTGVKIIVVLAALSILIMPQLRYEALHTAFYDLGQYTTNYMLATQANFAGIMLRSHAHLLMPLFIPIFKLVPRPETLLAIQSLILVAVIWFYARLWTILGARGFAGDRAGWSGALLVVLSLSIWSSALFDYHFEHLLALLYVMFFWCLERPSRGQAIKLFMLGFAIALVKENYALTSVGLGLLLVLSRRHVFVGWALIVACSAYFIIVTMLIIPAFSDGQGSGELWRKAFSYLGRTPLDMIMTLLTNPYRLIEANVLTARKVIYFEALLCPFLLVIVLRPQMLIPALPAMAITFLSLEPNHFYLVNQYSVAITMPVLVACAYVLAGYSDWPERFARIRAMLNPKITVWIFGFAVFWSALFLWLFSPAPLSRLFFKNEAWSFHYSAYQPTARDQMIGALIEQYIPQNPDLVVVMQNNLHHGRLSLRYNALAFPQGILQPAPMLKEAVEQHKRVTGQMPMSGMIWADYVVIDTKRPAYVDDRLFVEDGSDQSRADQFRWLIVRDRLHTEFDQLVNVDGFEIWKRRLTPKAMRLYRDTPPD
jgi:uncharacterized membrane protein